MSSRDETGRKIVGRSGLVNRVFQVLSNDDVLLRLLSRPYLDESGNYVDCLTHGEDIVGKEDHQKVVRENIIKTIKSDDIIEKQDCLIFMHLGKRRAPWGNYKLARQELLIDVVVHNDYQNYDYRLDDICDRLDYLIVDESFGLGKADISTPIPYEAPREYYRHQLKYNFWSTKK